MMRDIRYNISLYITVPVIFSGLSALSIIAGYRLTRYYLEKGMSPEWPLAFWGLSLILIAFFCGLMVVKVLIDPIRKFVGKTKNLGLVRDVPPSTEVPDTGSDMQQYAQIFDQVADLLSKVEARELFPEIIGQSKAIRLVLNQILKVSVTDTTVLLFGETGTGKELIANSIHAHSRRQANSFVAINCAAIPSGLIESELFGYQKGAFTGADNKKPGKFEIADGGTLFLDEIGDMPMDTQAKVLRVLEKNHVERLGDLKPRKIDVRLITATHQDLPDLVESNQFRQDLFFRLNVFMINLPPLRERREDIPLLADYFLRKGNEANKQLSSSTIQILMAYNWPGNIRELKHAIESASLMAENTIEPLHLPASIIRNTGIKPIATTPYSLADEALKLLHTSGLDEHLRQMEMSIIKDALHRSKGVQKQAAGILGIKERSLWHRLRKYGIDATRFKDSV